MTRLKEHRKTCEKEDQSQTLVLEARKEIYTGTDTHRIVYNPFSFLP